MPLLIGKGVVEVNSHVKQIIVEDGMAVGVELRRKGAVVRAKRAVISNASIWDTLKLIPEGKKYIIKCRHVLINN